MNTDNSPFGNGMLLSILNEKKKQNKEINNQTVAFGFC